jgi:hypothetical protein
MAFIPVLNCVLARLQWQHSSGVVAENRFYCATVSAPTETDLSEIGADIVTFLLAGMSTYTTEDWTATQIVLRAMNEEEGLEMVYTTDLPINMANGAAPTPLQVCYTVTFSTGLVGRSARGRAYGLGVPTTLIEDQKRLSATGQTDFQSAWATLKTTLEGDGHALQVVSFVDAGVPRTEGRALPVTAVNVRFPLATQRRRLS